MNAGFIGLGHMGTGMAARLLKAGHQVTVYNRTPSKVDALVAQGAKAAAEVAEACRGDAVVTKLANDETVERVVLGKGAVIASLAPDTAHISSELCLRKSSVLCRAYFMHASSGKRLPVVRTSVRS